MSAGVSDQRMKGQGNQVTNGPKDHVNEHEEFDTWRAQHQQNYTDQISTTMASDPFIPSYYGTSFPYQTFSVGDGPWSNSEPMAFLGGYGGQLGHDSYGMDSSMFGGAFGQAATPAGHAGYNYFHGNNDYSTWGTNSSGQQIATAPRKAHYDDPYYRHQDNIYPASDNLKGLEHGMQGLNMTGMEAKSVEIKEKEIITAAPQQKTWASIASQPAKPQPTLGSGIVKKKGPGMPPPPMVPGKHNMDIGTWDGKNGGSKVAPTPPVPQNPAWNVRGYVCGPPQRHPPPGTIVVNAAPPPQSQPVISVQQVQQQQTQAHQQTQLSNPQISTNQQQQQSSHQQPQQKQLPNSSQLDSQNAAVVQSHPVLDELKSKNNYNPIEFDMTAKGARFFVIKSYSEDDIHRSIKYAIWCSTEHGNKRLDQAFRERENADPDGCVYLFFSVNGSGHFCGMAKMMSPVDYSASSSVWSQDKWKGQFRVRWIYVKDVPNGQLRHIKLENNENKPVTNSRDTQEVPLEKGRQVLRVMHNFKHTTSIFDDFIHYEKRQEEEKGKRATVEQQPQQHQHHSDTQEQHSHHNQHHHHHQNHHRERDNNRRGGRGGNRNH